MGAELHTFPSIPSFRQTVALGERTFVVRLTWRARLEGWYLDLSKPDGSPIAVGRRVSPQWGPLIGLLPGDAPDGVLYVRGPSGGYTRDMLGAEVVLAYYAADEIPSAPAVDVGVTVVLQ